MGVFRSVLVLCPVLVCLVAERENPTPIVMWHGMGDSCCNPFRSSLFLLKSKQRKISHVTNPVKF